jgi:hypothetical protein
MGFLRLDYILYARTYKLKKSKKLKTLCCFKMIVYLCSPNLKLKTKHIK